MKNKCAKRARISEAKIREIVRYVAADLTALQAAALRGLNRNTVNRLYRGVRERMLLACEAQRRLLGVVPDCSTPTLQGIIRGRVDPRTVINSDGWRGYHGLVDLGYGHVRVDHARDECTKGTVHITGIEGFWGLAKVRLTPFKGLPKHTFHLHLKETEWRYNHRRADKYKYLRQYLRKNPLS